MILLREVHRSFRVGDDEVHALRNVSLEIGPSEYVSVMGPSGSGKSTLLNILGLLDRPTAGVYEFDGENVTSLDELHAANVRREKIGFVFQFFHLVPRLTATENIELPLVLAGVPASERATRVSGLLQEFGIAHRARHRPDQLSGGERQRVAIARAMVMRPSAILADEPTGNLDQTTGKEVFALLEALNGRGVALILVTHDPILGNRAHRQIRMVDGEIHSDSGARQ
ncbi:MAG: putative transport system ATP-binding protein [Thermoanaerobaculia bacterium]|jgi:putative ABC transport system ATP-binding protein|nr:putative transport system ATP-binding protein [Thermoanaerobaculia bacterium]